MVRKSYAFLGILAVLLMSLGVVSATNGFELTVNGLGDSSSNPISGINGTVHNVAITLNHSNISLGDVQLNWTGGSGYLEFLGNGIVTTGEHEYTIKITLPQETKESYRTVTATFYNESNLTQEVGDASVRIYYNSTLSSSSTEIYGCMDSNANNYNPDATTDDGSCTYTTGDYEYCDDFSGEKGHLEITSFEITNNGKGGDEEWEYLDEIVIEVVIENTGNENIDDVMVELMIKDDDDNTVTRRKMGLDDDEIDLGRVKDDDEETAIFEIKELPIDLDEGTYRIYVRAYDEKNEDLECTSVSEDFNNDDETYFEFDVKSSDDATVIVKSDLDNILASCGDRNVEVRFMVYNIGDDDEEKVLVTLESSRLGLYEKVVIDNLRDKKGKEVVFFITIPDGLEKSYYDLDIYTYYDYDDDEDELDEVVAYGESSEEEGDDFSIRLDILSCKGPAPLITASLDSEAKVGEELVITASITNSGDDNNFVVSVSEFEDWAELLSVEPASLLINEDGTATITIKLTPTKSGFQTLKVNAIVDGEVSYQAVSVNIEEREGFFAGVSDTLLYSVSGVAALFILIFLVLIVRISRKSRKPEF